MLRLGPVGLDYFIFLLLLTAFKNLDRLVPMHQLVFRVHIKLLFTSALRLDLKLKQIIFLNL